jgi:hypothetical protein
LRFCKTFGKRIKMAANTKEVFLNISYNDSVANFEELFKNQPMKYVGITFACVALLVILFLCYGIIWFERFGSGRFF